MLTLLTQVGVLSDYASVLEGKGRFDCSIVSVIRIVVPEYLGRQGL